MVIRNWMDCPLTTFGRLREWRIFTRRQGNVFNADTGEVCFDMSCYGRAVVLPGVTTEPATWKDDVTALCVASGEGFIHLRGGKRGGRTKGRARRGQNAAAAHALRPGSSLLIPANVPYWFQNTGGEDLEFIFSRRPPSSTDNELVVHHWTEDRPKQEWGSPAQGHWYHSYRGPNCELHIADLPPHKFSHPHSHAPQFDEIWYVHSGQGWHWMGQDYRPHYPGWALWLDPSELHALMNPTETNVEYIYATSAALVRDRAAAAPRPPKVPSAPADIAVALEESFGALVQAYGRTGVSIHDLSEQIPRIEQLIKALKRS